MANKECAKCIHKAVCKTAESCDGYVSGCKHFNTGWISVNERLPSEKKVIDGETYFKNVAVWVKHLEYEQIAFYDDDAEWWFYVGNFLPVMGEVTHWMPLPEPPKGE